MSNAAVERGASAVKRLKSRLRSRMKNVVLSSLLQVLLNGTQLQTDEGNDLMTEAAKVWRKPHTFIQHVTAKGWWLSSYRPCPYTFHGIQTGPEEIESVEDLEAPNLNLDVLVDGDTTDGEDEMNHQTLNAMDVDTDGDYDSDESDIEFDIFDTE